MLGFGTVIRPTNSCVGIRKSFRNCVTYFIAKGGGATSRLVDKFGCNPFASTCNRQPQAAVSWERVCSEPFLSNRLPSRYDFRRCSRLLGHRSPLWSCPWECETSCHSWCTRRILWRRSWDTRLIARWDSSSQSLPQRWRLCRHTLRLECTVHPSQGAERVPPKLWIFGFVFLDEIEDLARRASYAGDTQGSEEFKGNDFQSGRS